MDARVFMGRLLVVLLLSVMTLSQAEAQEAAGRAGSAGAQLTQAVKDEVLAAAGFTRSRKGWRNECGNAVPTEFSQVKLDDKGRDYVIVTSTDAPCYGQAETSNTVLRREHDGRWVKVIDLVGELNVISRYTRGYRELVLGGPGYCGNEVYRWSGKTYAYQCNAADDAEDEVRAACMSSRPGIRWCKPAR
jgi:hypothetical protein